MINLLPAETKRQLRAAHTNAALIKYLFFSGIAVAFLVLACVTSYLFLNNNKSVASNTTDNGQSSSVLQATAQKQLDSLITSISTAKSILREQVLYSDIVTGIAAALPSGIVLDKLTLDNNTIGTAVTLQAHARSSDNTSLLQDNFSKSALFSNYNLISPTTNSSSSPGYPIAISIGITINKGMSQ